MKFRQRLVSRKKNEGDTAIPFGHDEASQAPGSKVVSEGRRSLRSSTSEILLAVGVCAALFFVGILLGEKINERRHPTVDSPDVIPMLRGSKRARRGLDPSRWESFSHGELNSYFGCRRLFEAPRPIITDGQWRYFRDLYNQYEAEQKPDDEDGSYKMGKEPFDSPVEGAFTPQKGRGLIATRDISKGEKIFTASNNTIVFETGHSWRKFVWHLGHAPPPPDGGYREGFACDILAWSWNQRVPADGPARVVVDVDASSLLNKPSRGERANVRCGKKGEGCMMDYYAKTDIRKGDEILCNYGDFARPLWHKLGL